MDLAVGQVVRLKEGLAIVRYSSTGKKKDWLVGVEFWRDGVGDCNGSFQGKQHFLCASNRGKFITDPDKVTVDLHREIQAVTKIQARARGIAARRKTTEMATFRMWNILENREEGETLSKSKRYYTPAEKKVLKQIEEEEGMFNLKASFSSDLDISESADAFSPRTLSDLKQTAMEETDRSPRRRASSLARRMSQKRASIVALSGLLPGDERIDPKYQGPRLKWPIDRNFGLELLDHFRENPNIPLPKKYAWELLCNMENHLKNTVKGAVFYVEFPKKPDARIVVVGDTHGQLNDVLWIFYKFGPPSPSNLYLFNGDIADRGAYAVEIFMLLFAFKLAHPESVVINRGNHESADLNEVYGFAAEVRSKYCATIYSKFQDVFNLLPLCIIIERRILVVHGGLFRKDDVTLQMIDKIDRIRPCPVSPTTVEDALMFDILWSDPQQEPGRGLSTRGVDCISFGPDVTDNFLTLNNLEVCIRSHQVPINLRGFEPVHEGYCVTLFSASNYCGTTGNFGGVIIFEPDMAFEIQEYMAPTLEDIKMLHRETQLATKKVRSHADVFKDLESRASRRNRRSSVINMQRDVLRKIARLICENKQELWTQFWEKDQEKSGKVSPLEWRAVCSDVIGKDVPWTYLQKKLKITSVHYPSKCMTPIFGSPVEGGGEVSGGEYLKVKKTDLDSSSVDAGYILYNEFLSRYKIEFRPKGARHENWRRECVQQVFESILLADLSLKETLMVFDRNCDGTVSYREFFELLSELDLGLSEPQVRLLMRIITANHCAVGDPAGRIDAAEFLGRFKVIYAHAVKERSTAKEDWVRKDLEAIGRCILVDRREAAQRHYESQQPVFAYDPQQRRRSSAIRAVALFQKFKEYNERGDGFLSYSDFVMAIQRLPGIDQVEKELGYPLDEDRLIRLAQAIDATRSGKINYLEFLDAFHVVDNNSTSSVAEELWSHICSTLFQARQAIRRALYGFDPMRTGKADVEDFRSALMAANDVFSLSKEGEPSKNTKDEVSQKSPLTEDQIESLVNCVDLDESGLVNYEDFLESFVVVDVTHEDTNSECSDLDSDEQFKIHDLVLEEFGVQNVLDNEDGKFQLRRAVSSFVEERLGMKTPDDSKDEEHSKSSTRTHKL